jgi:hypothetical protein
VHKKLIISFYKKSVKTHMTDTAGGQSKQQA